MSELFDKIEAMGLKALGKVQLTFVPPKVRAEHLRLAMKFACEGTIIARKYDHYLDSLLIPGSYSHTGVCESNTYMIHAVGEGVGRIDVLDFVKDCDGFIMLRPKQNLDFRYSDALSWLRAQRGKNYDFKFNGQDASALFCHETTAGYCIAGGFKMLPIRKSLLGIERDIYTADQFIDDTRFEIIYKTEF